MTTPPRRRPPVWFTILMVVLLLPIIAWPFVIMNYNSENSDNWWIINIFPIYALLTGYLSYKCYVERREISYILLIMLILSYISVPFLM